jgi:hypothetical protein
MPTTSETFYGGCLGDSVYDQAKQDEIKKWKSFKTYIEVPDNGQKSINTRWVCTRKIKGGQVVYKARLVARGFEEQNASIRTDSPTCSKESLRLALILISCNGWKLHSLDVKSAFLQGTRLERDVFIKPPAEANVKCLWKMLRCPYGIADAGRLWYLRLRKKIIETGMIQCKYDQAVFMWFCDGVLSGLLTCHVDDIVFGGCNTFHAQVIMKIRSIFTIGLEEDTNLKYLGLRISQQPTGIEVSTQEYANSLKPLPIPSTKISDQGFTADQTTLLKQFCGQVNWLSTQGRPDISYQSCFISNSLKSGDSKVFAAANKIVRKVQNQEVLLRYNRDFDVNSCYVISFADASFANLPNAGSQGAYVIMLVDQNGLYTPICWQSRKVRRVVKSTIAAECLAAVEAAEMAIYISALLKDMLQSKTTIKTYVFSDNKNLVSATHSSTNIEDRRLVIDISVLRDLLSRQELTDLLWVSTENQLANALTKQGASDKLLINVFNNFTRFCFDSVNFQ